MDGITLTLPVLISIVSVVIAAVGTVVRFYIKSRDEWRFKDEELERRIYRLEQSLRSLRGGLKELQSTNDDITDNLVEIGSRVTVVETNSDNVERRVVELTDSQRTLTAKLDEKVEKLTDLIIRYLSDA